MRGILMAAGLALAAIAATPAAATPVTLPQAETLDRLPAEYTRDHRHWERRHDRERHGYYRHGRGYDRGYGYGRRHGGPPPWAPAHGYRRHHYERF
uniref:Uncharacterized protein n=1 Tax=Bosea sp. NBC_00436 TaxID=2969620 RepID=A0A9E7ZJG9_9HYPH